MPTTEMIAAAMEMSIATLMLLFAGYLLFGTGNRNAPAQALATLTATVGLSLLLSLLGSVESLEFLRLLRPLLALLIGPALLVYVSRVSAQSAPLGPGVWLHLVPAAGGIALMMSPINKYMDFYLNAWIGIYWLMSAAVYRRRRKILIPSSVRRFVLGLVAVLGILFVVDVVLSMQVQAPGGYRSLPVYIVGLLILFAGAARMMWITLNNPQLLAGPKLFAKYQRSGLDEVATHALAEQLVSLMAKHKLFLEENVSLAMVADRLEVQPRHLSQAVNSRFGTNFSAYINEQRVREAAHRLKTEDKTVSQVIYAVGFSSKSSFNREFRRHFGMSPKEWRASKTC